MPKHKVAAKREIRCRKPAAHEWKELSKMSRESIFSAVSCRVSKLPYRQGVTNGWKSMIGKSIDQSMVIDYGLLIGIDWHRPIDNHRKVVVNYIDCASK